MSLPEGVAEHDRLGDSRAVLALLERPAEVGRDAKCREKPIRDVGHDHARGIAFACQRQSSPGVVCGHRGERMVLLAPRQEVGVGEREDLAIRSSDGQMDEPIRLAKRKRAQQHGLDDREDGRRRAHAEGEGKNRQAGKARPFYEEAQREADVLKDAHGVLDGGRTSAVRRSGRDSIWPVLVAAVQQPPSSHRVTVFDRLFLLVCVLVALMPPLAAAQVPGKRVLLLYSHEREMPMYAGFDRALRTRLQSGVAQPIEFYTEYLDLMRFPDPLHRETSVDYFRVKYSGPRIDLIVTVSSLAFDFIVEHGDVIFPDIPVIFTSVNASRLAQLTLKKN